MTEESAGRGTLITDENTPLLSSSLRQEQQERQQYSSSSYHHTKKYALYEFLEGRTTSGRRYEFFMILLITLNVLSFIVGTLFIEEYNTSSSWSNRTTGICGNKCDRWFFGNYADNGLQHLQLSTTTSYLELVTVTIFTIDYICRLYTANYINATKYSGLIGRIRWIASFFSIIDLISILPFYIDAIIFRDSNFTTGTAFIRMFRFLRMMKVEGRYNTALTMVDDVYNAQKSIMVTSLFIGITTWIVVSSLYYLAERKNTNFIYCPNCPDINKDEYCSIDYWGFVNCTGDPCIDELSNNNNNNQTGNDDNNVLLLCYNLYESIPSASYYALLNLFGEFPHITDHSPIGQIVAIFTAAIAVAVFAIPVGIIGNGFETIIQQQRKQKQQLSLLKEQQQQSQQEQSSSDDDDNDNDNEGHTSTTSIKEKDLVMTRGYIANNNTAKGYLYNLLHGQNIQYSLAIDYSINFLIIVTASAYIIETTGTLGSTSNLGAAILDVSEFIAVLIFTIEYTCRVYSATEDPKYDNTITGYIKYMTTFLAVVDLLSFAPYWMYKVYIVSSGQSSWLFMGTTPSDNIGMLVSSLRLLRILRFERYTHAFTTFDDVFRANKDVLAVTAFTAILCWVFFAAILYVTERDSPNPEMAANYNNIPNSMWITLLNLSGEAPLSEYSVIGKVVIAILGLFATGIFGIPIGVLGAGFEEIVAKENKDNETELLNTTQEQFQPTGGESATTSTFGGTNDSNTSGGSSLGVSAEKYCYNFVNGIGSVTGQYFELMIYGLIFLAVIVGCWQTVEGHTNDYSEVEWLTVIVFTIEYIIRFIGVGADPLFADDTGGWFGCRVRFLLSFYSVIDLLAIVPFYLSIALPNSIVNEYDEYLRMIRIIRLVKLDKYVPSITLVDDVFRLKFQPLRVAFYAAMTLWTLFAAAVYLCEHKDTDDSVDPVPIYGCADNCTMADRFQTFFDSMYYTGIHLTGDYPITTYTWPARFILFFTVIAAVGVVSIPSGLIASGFEEIVKTRNRSLVPTIQGRGGQAGDDWYEITYRALEGVEPLPSSFGPKIDSWQTKVNEFLNGKELSDGTTEWTTLSFSCRIFIFVVIISNVFAVLLESIPSIDKAVGNEKHNFFDVFEFLSVMIFATEYILRLFCAPKSRAALYSTFVYATTFFGIVDFLSTAPWFIEQALVSSHVITADSDYARIFRIFRIFRILQLEDFLVAFRKLDNVFRASKDVLKATGLLALIIWVGCGALFFIFEENNPNWRQCSGLGDVEIPPTYSENPSKPGCYDFKTTAACNEYYPGMCEQRAFTNMPNSLYYTAVFLGGEWGLVDFTWPGRLVALFLCVVGIGLYAIPIGSLFNSFGAVLGLADDDDEEEENNDI